MKPYKIFLRFLVRRIKQSFRYFPGLKRLGLKLFEWFPDLEAKIMKSGVYYSGVPLTVDPAERDILAAHLLESEDKPRQLLLDLSVMVLGDNKTGIQRVVRSLLFELLKQPETDYCIQFVYASASKQPGFYYAKQFTRRLLGLPETTESDPLVQVKPGDKFMGLDFSPFIIPAQIDVLKQMQRDGAQVYFMVYDLLPLALPHLFDIRIRTKYSAWLETITQFDAAICISESVAKELKAWGTPPTFDIRWMHMGADIENSLASRGLPDNAKAFCDRLRQKTSFLMVGTLEPRKKHAQVLAAFEHLWAQGVDVQLVIVGKEGWMVQSLARKLRRHPEASKRLFWLEAMSDEYLRQVYHAAHCLIAASEGEGFGLPLIESAKHQLPIIARDLPVFREVAGNHAFYFKGDAPLDLATAVQDWLVLYQAGEHPCSADMPWLTWEESAQQLSQALGLCEPAAGSSQRTVDHLATIALGVSS